ncbi:MAG: transposase, partial [Clostridiales bacterium]|nr:transposase [Clostridiales bacterium]
ADAKEKHAMRYTPYRGLTAVTAWVKLKFAAMNLKKLAIHKWQPFFRSLLFSCLKPHCCIAMGLILQADIPGEFPPGMQCLCLKANYGLVFLASSSFLVSSSI